MREEWCAAAKQHECVEPSLATESRKEGGSFMDGKRLDALSRAVGAARDRRGMLGALAGVALGGLALSARPEEAEAGLPIVGCKPPGKKCDSNQRCCSGRCKKRRCVCSKKGRPCWQPLEGALCCSQRCHNGKCD